MESSRPTSGRRSPPSDVGEYRRRIRARHGARSSGSPPAPGNRPGSFGGSSASSVAPPAPPRERPVNLPGYQALWGNRRPITPNTRAAGGPGAPRLGMPISYPSVRFADHEGLPTPPPAPVPMPVDSYDYQPSNLRMGPVYDNPLRVTGGNPPPPAPPAGISAVPSAPHSFMPPMFHAPPREPMRDDLAPGLQGEAGQRGW